MSSKHSIEQMNQLADFLESMKFSMESYSIGQMAQLAKALKAANFTPAEVTKLGQMKNLSDIRGLFCGTHELKLVRHVIDCDADPFVPEGWKVEVHRKGGQMEWGTEKVLLYLSESQKNGKHIKGNKLRKELENMPCCNANVLDYLLAHPELIPEEWKRKAVFFWDTIYRHFDDSLYVRLLLWVGDQWDWSHDWLDNDFYDSSPAGLRAS